MEDLRHVLMARVLHVLKFCSWSCCPHKSPCGSRVTRFLLITPFSRNLNFEHFPVASLENFRFLDLCSSTQVSPCSSSSFTGLTGCPKSCGKFTFALHKLRYTKLTDVALTGTIGLGFAVGSRFLTSFWHGALLFDRIRKKFRKWLRENIQKLIMLNKRSRWFHSSREKLPMFRISANWFWVSTYLIWILGSNLILWNNQSSATLWVPDTCLIVELRLLINNPLDDSFGVFKSVQLRRTLRRMRLGVYVILWLPLQVCWPTTECLVFQFVPSSSMSIQFVSKLVTILQLSHVLPAWLDGHPGKDLKLCITASLSCLPAQRIFEHVPTCRRTTLLFLREAFPPC